MQAARAEGLTKVVHCSSLGAVGINPNGASTEEWAVSPYEETTDYEISKAFAELEVYKEIARGLLQRLFVLVGSLAHGISNRHYWAIPFWNLHRAK